MGVKAILIHPSYQGVCGRHAAEDLCVTPGELIGFLSGVRISDPISEERSGKRCPASSRTAEEYRKRGESRVTPRRGSRVGWGRRPAKVDGKGEEASE
jgi:hypothetical protein